MKNTLSCLLTIFLLATCLMPGSGHIVQAQTPYPLPDGEIMPSSDVDVEIQTLTDVESFDCSDVTDVPVSECEALVAFYLSTNGAGWNNQQECSGDENDDCWLTTTKVDQWFGITVYEGRVTELVLDGNNLSGTIPLSIDQLMYLVELCLMTNQIEGSIPITIGNLTNLEKLTLGNNLFSGSIPEEIGYLSNLHKLNLGNNQLEGTLPVELGNLSLLERIWVYDNLLHGELPSELGQLTHLEELLITNNLFSGSIPISFINLEYLDYFYFRLTDLCEPYNQDYFDWKETVLEYHGTDLICMDFHCFMPIISR
jgi:Leucine-rich repeat (LRR) protein